MASPSPSPRILKFAPQLAVLTGIPDTPPAMVIKQEKEKVKHPRGAQAFSAFNRTSILIYILHHYEAFSFTIKRDLQCRGGNL
jgi:hypothetical protein